jgi:hypothetical protein
MVAFEASSPSIARGMGSARNGSEPPRIKRHPSTGLALVALPCGEVSILDVGRLLPLSEVDHLKRRWTPATCLLVIGVEAGLERIGQGRRHSTERPWLGVSLPAANCRAGLTRCGSVTACSRCRTPSRSSTR